jgi:hypothetical protein
MAIGTVLPTARVRTCEYRVHTYLYLVCTVMDCVYTCMYCYILVYTWTYRYVQVHTRMSWHIPVHTGIYWDIPVCPGTYQYVPVHTGMYRYIPGKTKILHVHNNWTRTSDLQHTKRLVSPLRYCQVPGADIGFVETRYIYIVIANSAAWYLLADVGHPAPVPLRPPLRPLRHGPSHLSGFPGGPPGSPEWLLAGNLPCGAGQQPN